MTDATAPSRPPSGRQIELAHGDQRAVAVEVGGGLREYSVAGRSVLDSYPLGEMCSAARGQVLAPWPNRLDAGRYRFAGVDHQLPITEPERANAIHGIVRWASWAVDTHDRHRAVLRHALHPQPGYPFDLELTVEYALASAGLTVTTVAANHGATTAPFGLGFHPYLLTGDAHLDDAVLTVPATQVVRADGRGIPTGTVDPVDRAGLDFREGTRIESRRLDDCFAGLAASADGTVRVSLSSSRRADPVVVWMEPAFAYVMVYTGDTLEPGVRRRSIAIEPMTCPPNAFVSGEAVISLEPGARRSFRWGISPG